MHRFISERSLKFVDTRETDGSTESPKPVDVSKPHSQTIGGTQEEKTPVSQLGLILSHFQIWQAGKLNLRV